MSNYERWISLAWGVLALATWTLAAILAAALAWTVWKGAV